ACRFAGAVWSDQRQKLTATDFECDAIDGVNAAEGFVQIADRKHRHGALCQTTIRLAMRRATPLARTPTIPPGNTSTSSKMMAPSRARQYSVWRMTVSCSVVKIAAPAIGPLRESRPPSSTMTMA